jgi:hypothetical protein
VLLPQLRRIRWAVRAALVLGVAASVAANILHAEPNPISQAISAWPPLALLLTVELTSRIPMHRRSLAALRVLATITIASIAAWVSYWHMQGVAEKYGETQTSAYLLPLSVDGLIVVASVSLVELAGRVRVLEERRNQERAAAAAAAQVPPVRFIEPAPAPAPQAVPVPAFPATAPSPRAEAEPLAAQAASVPVEAPVSPAVAPVPRQATPALSLADSQGLGPLLAATQRPTPAYVNGSTPPARPTVTRAAVSAPARTVVTAPTTKAGVKAARAAASVEEDTAADDDQSAPRQRRPVLETAELAAAIKAMHPEISEADLAKQLGISATRLRAVRREAKDVRRTPSRA